MVCDKLTAVAVSGTVVRHKDKKDADLNQGTMTTAPRCDAQVQASCFYYTVQARQIIQKLEQEMLKYPVQRVWQLERDVDNLK